MGVLPQQLAAGLRDRLGLKRAIETGTYLGAGSRRLAALFPKVVTIEVEESLARKARSRLAPLEHVEVISGSSRSALPALVDPSLPTLYWLDGHWSGGITGGAEDQCPVLAEIRAVRSGHPHDCILIDDARLFLAPPPPPHAIDQWPSYQDVLAALHETRSHHVIVAHDLVIAVPQEAADLANAFAHAPPPRGDALMTRTVRYARARLGL